LGLPIKPTKDTPDLVPESDKDKSRESPVKSPVKSNTIIEEMGDVGNSNRRQSLKRSASGDEADQRQPKARVVPEGVFQRGGCEICEVLKSRTEDLKDTLGS